ncbi:hypothetical protein LBMAG18_02140 [Alphaproteobacteria bacterium]|nr:hypothetical protein LBMAG18_02140 [Alphaproteobacteria bacterium]
MNDNLKKPAVSNSVNNQQFQEFEYDKEDKLLTKKSEKSEKNNRQKKLSQALRQNLVRRKNIKK